MHKKLFKSWYCFFYKTHFHKLLEDHLYVLVVQFLKVCHRLTMTIRNHRQEMTIAAPEPQV